MIVSEEFLSKLRRSFNLNLYEVKLWTALLSRGISTAGELSNIADVPRSRTYDVLESLERKGFIVVKPEKPICYLAVSPNEVLDRVRRRVEETTKDQARKLDTLQGSEVLTELSALYTQGVEPMHPTDFSGALKGRHNLYDHLALMVKEAEKSVSIVTTDEGFVRKMRFLRLIFEKAKARGVDVRIIAPLKDNESGKVAKKMTDLVRIKSLNFDSRFCVVDNKQVMFMLVDDKDVHPSYDLAMWVNTPFFAKTLQGTFNTAWGDSDKSVEEDTPEIEDKDSE